MAISFQQYLGLDSAHLVEFQRQDGGANLLIEQRALEAFRALQADAASQGFTIEACSAYRSFERQAMLFGAKFLGQRPILDRNEQVITEPITDPVRRMEAILVFSAMPGFSRHHFGSDLDIYAPNLLPQGQSLQLTYHEYLPGAYFYELGQYLQENLSRFDFANPYTRAPQASAQHDGEPESKQAVSSSLAQPQVGYEPWHISYLPAAAPYLKAYDMAVALDYVSKQDLPYAPWVRQVMTPAQVNAMLRFDVC